MPNEITTSAQGSRVLNSFHMHRERGYYDADKCASEGWEQFDTDQDASYFGVWVHHNNMQIVCFAEGDESITNAPDREAFTREIEALEAFHCVIPRVARSISAEGQACDHYGYRLGAEQAAMSPEAYATFQAEQTA